MRTGDVADTQRKVREYDRGEISGNLRLPDIILKMFPFTFFCRRNAV